jgi:hypothetical protein
MVTHTLVAFVPRFLQTSDLKELGNAFNGTNMTFILTEIIEGVPFVNSRKFSSAESTTWGINLENLNCLVQYSRICFRRRFPSLSVQLLNTQYRMEPDISHIIRTTGECCDPQGKPPFC